MSLSQWAEQQINIAKLYRNLSQENPVTLSIESGGQSFSVVVSYAEPGFNVPFNVIWVSLYPGFYGVVFRRSEAKPATPFANTWERLVDYLELFAQPQVWRAQDFSLGELEKFLPPPASANAPGMFTLTSGNTAVSDSAIELHDDREPLPHDHGPIVNRYLQVGAYLVDLSNSKTPNRGDVLVIVRSENGILIGEWVKLAEGDILYDGPWPVSFAINGPSGAVDEMTQVQFTADLTFEDGSVVRVNPAWELSDSSIGTLSSSGVFQSYNLAEDIGLRVSARYSHVETESSFAADFDFAVREIDSSRVYQSLEIVGPTEVLKSGTVTYTVNAVFDDGFKIPVVPDFWTLSNSSLGSISQNGIFTAASVRDSQELRLTAYYTYNGVSKYTLFDIVIIDSTIYPTSAEVVGPDYINENSSGEFQLEVTFENGRKQRVAVFDWGASNQNAGNIGRTTGIFVAPNLNDHQSTIITASYTLEGTTVSAQKTINVMDTTVYPESIDISGAAAVNEGRSEQYQATVYFTDGSSAVHQVLWSIDSESFGNIDAASGLFTAISDVSADSNSTISTSFSKNGKTVSASKTITVKTTQNLPVSAVISAPSSLSVGSSDSAIFTVTYQDGTTARLKPQWSLSNTNIASISADGLLTALEVYDAATVTVYASYSASGITVTAEAVVTINTVTARPISANVSGPTSVDTENTVNYALDVKFSDNATRRVSASWNSSNTDVGTISQVGSFIPKAIGTTVLTGVYTSAGQTVSASLEVSVT